MSITTAAVSKVTDTDAHFLIDGVIHEVSLAAWRGGARPTMGDTVEIVFDQGGQVSRFFPIASSAPEPIRLERPKLTFGRPQYRKEEVEILGNPYLVWRRHGIVVSADSQTQTSISTGYRTLMNGQVVANVQSAEYTTSEIRLLHEDGSVKEYEFSEKFKVRDGDEVSICYVAEKPEDPDASASGWPLGIQNHTTQKWQASTHIWNAGETHQKLRFHRALANVNSFKAFMAHCAATGLIGALAVQSPLGGFWALAGLLTFVVHYYLLAIIAGTSGQRQVREVAQKLLEAF